MNSHRRSRHLEAPLVVSMAALVAFGIACASGSADPSGDAESNVSSGGSSSPAPCSGPAPQSLCGSAQCIDGQWALPSCDILWVSPWSRDCPAVAPAAGGSCVDYERGLRCEYGACTADAGVRNCNPNSARWESLPCAAADAGPDSGF